MRKAESCPWCGGASVEKTKSVMLISYDDDRRCVDCSAQWAPPIPWIVGLAFLIILASLSIGCLAVIVYSEVTAFGPPFVQFPSRVDVGARLQVVLPAGFLGILFASGAYASFNVVRGKSRKPQVYAPGRVPQVTVDALPAAEDKERLSSPPLIERVKVTEPTTGRVLVYGILWFIFGVVATIVSYRSPSAESMHVVFYGAIVVGGVLIVAAFFRWLWE